MMGASATRAASMQALMDELVTQFTAGMAYLLSWACCKRSSSACPVTTPGFTDGGRLGYPVMAHWRRRRWRWRRRWWVAVVLVAAGQTMDR